MMHTVRKLGAIATVAMTLMVAGCTSSSNNGKIFNAADMSQGAKVYP